MAAPVSHGPATIASPGRNCWRRERAERAAFLIDGAAYFDAFAAAAERAQHSIFILAWDFHGAVCLRADDQGRPATRLDEFLDDLVRHRRDLNVYVLDWDYPLLYAIERQLLPAYRFRWWTHRRFQFRLDAQHATAGSHHQKVVVIDDALAFAGGIDFAPGRWDTPNHTCDDPCRVSPSGEPCGPYHDLMMAVDGPAAAALGALARERWYRATGNRLPAPAVRGDCWPASLPVDLSNVPVAIARTVPPTEERPAIREVEALYCDAIAAARRWIYIENQYLTAQAVGEELCRRLQEADGPEIVIVTTQECAGWLEEGTMGVLRKRLVERMLAADRYGRLRLFTPVVPGLTSTRYTVHAKAMIVDGTFARIGSANLNNRSMGLDSECDLAVEAAGDAGLANGIHNLCVRLLAEHLCAPAERVKETFARTGSLIATIEGLRRGEHTLEPLDYTVPEWLDGLMPEAKLVDPDQPIDPQELLEQVAPVAPDLAPRSRRWALIVITMVTGAALWGLALHDRWGLETVASWFAGLDGSPLAPFVATGLFVLGAVLFVPVTILIAASGMTFGPVEGVLYAALGASASAVVGYGFGRLVGAGVLHRWGGRRWRPLRLRLARHGVLAVTAVRLLPLGPFTLVNMTAGVASVRLRDFVLGTLIGMSPGIVALTIFGDRLAHATREPTVGNIVVAALLALILVVAGIAAGQRLARRSRSRIAPRRSPSVPLRSVFGHSARSAQIGK